MPIENVVIYLKQYSLNKKIIELLKIINPLLVKKEDNIRVHLEALVNQVITEDEYQFLVTKMELGRLCLDIENEIPDGHVTLLFYSDKENKIYHGAAPNFSMEFFDFFEDINQTNSFGENCGSCGSAVFNKKVIVSDIRSCPLWDPFRENIMKWGFLTAWSIPFYKGDQVVGTFAIYHKNIKQVTQREIKLVQEKVAEYEKVIFNMFKHLVCR